MAQWVRYSVCKLRDLGSNHQNPQRSQHSHVCICSPSTPVEDEGQRQEILLAMKNRPFLKQVEREGQTLRLPFESIQTYYGTHIYTQELTQKHIRT